MLNLKVEFNYSSFQLFNYSSFQLFNYSSFQLFKFLTIQVLNYATIQVKVGGDFEGKERCEKNGRGGEARGKERKNRRACIKFPHPRPQACGGAWGFNACSSILSFSSPFTPQDLPLPSPE